MNFNQRVIEINLNAIELKLFTSNNLLKPSQIKKMILKLIYFTKKISENQRFNEFNELPLIIFLVCF